MKPVLPVLTTLLTGYVSSSLILAAAPPAARLTNSVIACQIIEQGANHRRWQKIVRTTDAQGNSFLTTNRDIVELATGLNYRDPVTGQWQPAKEEIDPAPGGAIAPFGQHQVSFADNLNAANAIVVQMSNGQTLQSGILGLSYYDTASGRSVMIAEIKDCQGQIVGSNQVLYTDAFNGVSANVRYTYTKAGLEQDVVLLKQPPVPETFGLSSATTVLQVLTEFSAAPQPQIRTNLAAVSAGGLPDESLDFGPMRLIRGKAFLLGTNFPAATVSKQWVNVNGRAILVESVRLGAIQKSLAQLPQTSRADEKPTNGSVLYAVSTERLLPARQPAKADPAGMALAKTMPSGKGLVLDYVEVNGNLNNYTFASGTTYFVSGPVYCGGTTTIQGGAVIKYPDDRTAFIDIWGDLNCQTGPYQPAIFTAGDDDRVGESLNGVWGGYTGIIDYPSGCTGGYGDPMLSMPADFEYGPWNMKIKNLRIYYARQVFEIDAFNAVTLSDSEVTNCGLVAVLDNSGNSSGLPLICNNCLFSSVATLVVDNTDQANYYHFNNCTIDHCPYIVGMEGNCGIYGGYYQDMVAVNCIFSSSGDENLSSLGGDYNGFYQSPLYLLNWWDWDFGAHQFISTDFPFQTAPEGDFYLTANCPFRNVGTTQIDSELLSDLQTLTTYAPQDGGQPDNDGMPDLGYHYPTLVAASVNAQLCPNSSLDVGAFNSNPDIFGLTLSYIIVGASSHGSLSGTPSDLIYTPNHCYEGSDSFTYKISDGFLTSPPATVTVAISDQVWANSDSWEQTCKNTTKQLNVSGGDSCGLPLTYRLVSGPSHAQSFSLSPDGAVSYTPVNGYCGTDSFRFQAVNPCGQLSAPATVTITVGEQPAAYSDTKQTCKNTLLNFNVGGYDPCSGSPRFALVSGPSHAQSFSLSVSGSVSYTPAEGYLGQDTFTFKVVGDCQDSA
ncbi:MAG TPA: Ig-like domain-containing protein, partial [Verrucomicrobiae bacterium]|nr:Ig-like domain-containing protein [Verrucomicrobiae bacterium]